MIEVFKNLINKRVKKLFLVVWPPLGEDRELDIDISFGFIFQQEMDHICVITTNKDDMWSPCIRFENIPQNTYCWLDFAPRMKYWMKSENPNSLEIEYYDVTEASLFQDIVGSEVLSIELLSLEGNSMPFGIKMRFDDEYILSTPIADGNTVETSRFHKNNNLAYFEKIGLIEFKKLTP